SRGGEGRPSSTTRVSEGLPSPPLVFAPPTPDNPPPAQLLRAPSGRPRGRLLQVLAEEGERPLPGVGGGGLVVGVGPLVVEERVVHARIDVDLRLFARLL